MPTRTPNGDVECREYEQVALLSQRSRAMFRFFPYLSVVSFNSTKRSLLLLVTYATDLLLRELNALFCCLWRNVESSCHKHFVVFSRNQHRRLLLVMCHNLQDGGRGTPATVFTTPGLSQR